MSSYSSAKIAVRSRASLGNVFFYILQIKDYWHLIAVIGLYFVRVTYQRTLLGPFWLLVHTLLPLLGMMAVFQHVGSFQTGDFPYPMFLISGMSLWTILDVGVKRGIRNSESRKTIQEGDTCAGYSFDSCGPLLAASLSRGLCNLHDWRCLLYLGNRRKFCNSGYVEPNTFGYIDVSDPDACCWNYSADVGSIFDCQRYQTCCSALDKFLVLYHSYSLSHRRTAGAMEDCVPIRQSYGDHYSGISVWFIWHRQC